MQTAFAAITPLSLRKHSSDSLHRTHRPHHSSNPLRQTSSPLCQLSQTALPPHRQQSDFRLLNTLPIDTGYRTSLLHPFQTNTTQIWLGDGLGGESYFQNYLSQLLSHLFGNNYLFEHDLLILNPLISKFRYSGDVKEFVREVCQSEHWREYAFERNGNIKFIEICFQVFLGRSFGRNEEVAEKVKMLNEGGFRRVVDEFVDCREFQERFGRIGFGKIGVDKDVGRKRRSDSNGVMGFNRRMKLAGFQRGSMNNLKGQNAVLGKYLDNQVGPSVEDIKMGYRYLRPVYEKKREYMRLPRSSLMKDWTASSHVVSPAAQNWNRPMSLRKSGKAIEQWRPGWTPNATGKESWSSGWRPRGKTKSYV